MSSEHRDLGIAGVTLAQRIGAGGNAIVYRARQPELDRVVVVKVLMVGDTDVTHRRFNRERRAMGRLSQAQGIAPVYDSGFTSGGQPYLIMPYYEHGSLQDRIDLSGRMDAEDVCRIGTEIAEAVQTAHDNDVLHRDLKPANILITRTGRADVADFGIAQILDDSGERSQAITMTPLYTAPEVFDGERPGPAGDVYSLGALLYALLNGSPAHADTTGETSVLSLMMRIKQQPLPPLPDDVPPALAAVVAKAMHRDKKKRYHSAAEVAAALRTVDLTPPRQSRRGRTSGSADKAMPAQQVETVRGSQPSQRRSLIVGALAFGLVIVGVAVATFFGMQLVLRGEDTRSEDTVVSGPAEVPTEVPGEASSEIPPAPETNGRSWSAVVTTGQVDVEAYSCGGVEQTRGVLVGNGLVLTSDAVASRPWRVDVIVEGEVFGATVVSLDRELALTSLQLQDTPDDLATPHLARATNGQVALVLEPGGVIVDGELASAPGGQFTLETSGVAVSPGSAVVNDQGSLIGIVNAELGSSVVPIVGQAIEGWQPVARDNTCADRSAAIGTDQLDSLASPRLKELLQLQLLAEAYASEDWDLVRQIEPGKSSLTAENFNAGWQPLKHSFLYPVDRDEIAANRVQWRLGLIGHERWDGEELTTLFCVLWEIDPATGTIVQTNGDTVRVYGSQDGEPTKAGWVDPGLLLGDIAREC